jgi:plasmid stabilization system protein ParE
MDQEKITIQWSKRASKSLESIFNYYFQLSEQSAERIRKEILKTVSTLRFVEQYQVDELNTEYRRMIVRHYKIIYKVKNKRVLILNIFDTRQDPSKSKL